MSPLRLPLLALLFALSAGLAAASEPPTPASSPSSQALPPAQETLLADLTTAHHLSPEQVTAVRKVLAGSPYIGTGNPAVTVHPVSVEACQQKLQQLTGSQQAKTRPAGALGDPDFERICGAPFMAPLYDPAKESPQDAKACIDQLEFPDIPCAYPVVWVRADEAAALCEAVGKRMCDAHEWEGACAGALEPPDYRFDLAKGLSPNDAVNRMRSAHNRQESARKSWSYGPASQKGICGMASTKTANCNGGDWRGCGSNTYPTGYFPECRSALGVYDLHGNAAEHMSLPLTADQLASSGSKSLGVTEMKGSWFIFDSYQAHEDWCRWRAPYWHGTPVRDPKSHHNYHLGFRCCQSLADPQEIVP